MTGPQAATAGLARDLRAGRRLTDRAFRAAMFGAAGIVLLVLAGTAVLLVIRVIERVRHCQRCHRR